MEEEQKQERSSDQQEQENIIPSDGAITVAPEALQSDTVARASTPRWDGTVALEQIITVVRPNGSIRRRIVARKVVNLGRCSTPGGIIHDRPSPSESEPSLDSGSESFSVPEEDHAIFTQFFYSDFCGGPG